MLTHLKITGFAVTTALVLFWLTAQFAPSELDGLMSNQLGQRTYEVLQQGRPVGYLQTSTRRTTDDHWELSQNLKVDMLNAPTYTSTQVMVFSGSSPYALISADFKHRSQTVEQQVSLEKIHRGYAASIQRNAATEDAPTGPGATANKTTERSTHDWTFTLNDQLSLERQLTGQTPIGSFVTSRYLDIQQLRVSEREHQLDQRSPRGFILRSEDDDSMTELDTQRRLIRFTAPHQFSFRLTQQHQDTLHQLIVPQTAQWTVNTAVAPLTADLLKPNTLDMLTLALNALGPLTLEQQGLPDTLSATASPKVANDKALGFLDASLTLPVGHPQILNLLASQETTAPHDLLSTSQQLIDLTRSQLLYAENQPAGSVLGSLQRGRGECVDFADLFTTLARTQGIASRTVYGIAYSALPSPGFRFHAWNEMLRNGRWHSVDPTWNQAVADATHIPLSDQTLAALATAMQRETIAFTPVEWDYRSGAL
jgi:hypothetical protein